MVPGSQDFSVLIIVFNEKYCLKTNIILKTYTRIKRPNNDAIDQSRTICYYSFELILINYYGEQTSN
jgi:hypothetical protein